MIDWVWNVKEIEDSSLLSRFLVLPTRALLNEIGKALLIMRRMSRAQFWTGKFEMALSVPLRNIY